jgi:predicted class III extradiol MEMO1 family dioxygenase
MGRRYGDPFAVDASVGPMLEVERRDRERLARICEGDLKGFIDLVQPVTDDLKWCGTTPLYTFVASMKPVVNIQGHVLHYQQWDIDPESVVTCAGIEFFEKE